MRNSLALMVRGTTNILTLVRNGPRDECGLTVATMQ